MDALRQISVLSDFLHCKVDEKGWSVKKFAEETGLSDSYAYELLAESRKKIPTDEVLNKIADVMGFSKNERKYILELALKERETGGPIYPPSPIPVPEPDPHPEPPVPPEPEPHPPAPHPPAPPVPVPGDLLPWYKRRDVMVALFVGLLIGSLTGCCSMWTIFHMFILGKYNWGF